MAVATSDFWLGIAALGVSILGGGLSMAWRLGGLSQRVRGVEDALEDGSLLREFRTDVDRRLRRLEVHAGFWGHPPGEG